MPTLPNDLSYEFAVLVTNRLSIWPISRRALFSPSVTPGNFNSLPAELLDQMQYHRMMYQAKRIHADRLSYLLHR